MSMTSQTSALETARAEFVRASKDYEWERYKDELDVFWNNLDGSAWSQSMVSRQRMNERLLELHQFLDSVANKIDDISRDVNRLIDAVDSEVATREVNELAAKYGYGESGPVV